MDIEIETKIEDWFDNGGWKGLFKTKPDDFEVYEDDNGNAFIRGSWDDGDTDFAGLLNPYKFVIDHKL